MCPFESPSPPFHTILPRIPVIYHFPVKFPDSSHTLNLERNREIRWNRGEETSCGRLSVIKLTPR